MGKSTGELVSLAAKTGADSLHQRSWCMKRGTTPAQPAIGRSMKNSINSKPAEVAWLPVDGGFQPDNIKESIKLEKHILHHRVSGKNAISYQ
jgi:hypothetical protein